MPPPVTDPTGDAVPFSTAPNGVRVHVRLAPGSAANRIDGIHAGGDGRAMLKVAVTAPPEGGKANAALIKLLAKQWRLAKSAIEITAGATDRRKVLMIEGEPSHLIDRLTDWLAARTDDRGRKNQRGETSGATTRPRGTQP